MNVQFDGAAPPRSLAARIFASLALLLFVGTGAVLTYAAALGAIETMRVRAWPETSCRIIESGAGRTGSGDPAYAFTVRYAYTAAGQEREGRVYRPGYTGSAQMGEAEALARRFLADTQVPCWVDPGNPGSAILAKPGLWTAASTLFPFAFVLVGVVGLFFVWRPSPAERERGRLSVSSTLGPRPGAGWTAAFFGIFVAIGVGISLAFILPALRVVSARSWREIPCTVISSEVRSHKGSKSTTYSADILYEYEAGGQTRHANRLDFLRFSSGGYAGKAALVAENPPGRQRTCFVNPDDPDEVVLDRRVSANYLGVLLPLSFIGVGLAGMLAALRKRNARKAVFVTGAADGPVTLATPSPAAKILGMLVFTLFWNGSVSVFLLQVIRDWKRGQPPVFLTIFLIPFALVGLGSIGSVVYFALAALNPRPRLTLSSRAIALGESATLTWSFDGDASRLTRLEIRLEGREEATYRSGKSRQTDRHTFATIPVYASEGGAFVGSALVKVPADTMHSFTAPSNRIVWALKLSGEIPKWPDVTEDVEIDVRPARGAETS